MIDLFKEIVSEDKLHMYFNEIRNDYKIISIINKWCDGFKDRDGKFVKEFQTTFNSSFWELYCYAVFKKMNMNINFGYDRPDYVMDYNNNKINVECVVSNNGQDDKPEHDIEGKLDDTSSEEKVYKQTLRILNSIHCKQKLYSNNYCKLNCIEGNPFLIALEPFDQPKFMDVGLEAINMVLYGINFNKKTLEEINILSVRKNDSTDLALGIFTNESYSDISGIIFSNMATMGKARAMSDTESVLFFQRRYNEKSKRALLSINYRVDSKNELFASEERRFISDYAKIIKKDVDCRKFAFRNPFLEEGYNEELTDGLHLFLNPYSKYPVQEEIINQFIQHGVQVHTFDCKSNTIKDVFVSDEFLIERIVFRWDCDFEVNID